MERQKKHEKAMKDRKEPFFKWVLTREFLKYTFTYELLIGLPYERKMKKSRVDFVYLDSENKTHAFEIKTKHDSFMRLDRQLDFYCKVFDFVSVVLDASDAKKTQKIDIPETVGLFVLDGEELKEVFKPEQNKLNLDYLYEILYVKELRQLDDSMRVTNRDERKQEFMQKNDVDDFFKRVRFGAHKKRADFIRKRFDDLYIQELKKIKKNITDFEFDFLRRNDMI